MTPTRQDPVRFERDLRVTIPDLGWRSEGCFLPGQHDISSVAFWYQTLPTLSFPQLPDRDGLEIVYDSIRVGRLNRLSHSSSMG